MSVSEVYMQKDKIKKDKLQKELLDIQNIKLTSPEQDPLYFAVNIVGGKWKIRILWVLRGGKNLRYGEIKQHIPSITDMMLSQSLKELADCGLILRRQYQQIPPKVEYQITKNGSELIPAVKLIWEWAYKQIKGEK